MTEPSPSLELRHVSKRFGAKIALRDVSLSVYPNEVIALLGANGAGKTTMLRALATLARPTRGSVLAFGVDAWSAKREVRRRIGVVAHQPYVYPELNCRENLRFVATMHGLIDDTALDEVLALVGLTRRADDRAATLSRGLLQRLNLARAIIHTPAALMLDEPDTGLDAAGRTILARIVTSQAERGGCVVFTTHALDLALDLASRVVVVGAGRLVLDAPRLELDRGAIEAAIIGERESVTA